MWRVENRKILFRATNLYLRRYKADETAAKNASAYPTPPRSTVTEASATVQPAGLNAVINKTISDKFMKMEPVEVVPDSEDMRKVASFEDVPGPTALRYLSKIWSFVPVLGNQATTNALQYVLSAGKIFGSQLSWGNNLAIFRYLLNEYGPVVRLHGPFGGDVVILSRPEHASIVFENEGPYPIRSSLDCVEKYRLEHRMYKQAGPFVMHGPLWETLRKKIEPALAQSLDMQYQKISNTCDEFINRIMAIRNRQQEVPKSFNHEINKWCMQCLFNIMFNRQMGFLDVRGLSSTSEASVLLDALDDATIALKKCELGLHLWKFFETPSWKKLVSNCDTIDHILGNYLRKAQDKLRNQKDNELHIASEDISLVDCFLLKDTMLSEDILTVLLDMMLLGVNMTSHTAGFMMYHLAKNPRAQHLLYQEIEKLPDQVKKSDLKGMKYLKACFHESLRLKPPMPVLSRILTKDINIHGYKIPKGTFMLIATNLSSLREEHFEDPLKFKPERWMGLDVSKHMEALASIPFGHGPKACLAKDLAEVQICYLMIKLLRKFRIEYHYGDIESNNRLLAAPSRPLKFRFTLRN